MCVCVCGGGPSCMHACLHVCVCVGRGGGGKHLDTCMHVHICTCVGGCGHVWVNAYECV